MTVTSSFIESQVPAAQEAEVDAADLAVWPGMGRDVHGAERRRLDGAAQGASLCFSSIASIRTFY